MSIEFNKNIHKISEKQFHEIDYQITGLAFQVHNDLGHLYNEKIYQHELANRCHKAGFNNVQMEVPIVVSHKDFTKKYYVDLLIDNSVIYELKAANSLTSSHEKQIINYLMLLELHHGQLINFKTMSIKKRFISTSIDKTDRYNFDINYTYWLDLDSDAIWFKKMMNDLIKDWGVFLDLNLFYDAICYFRGGVEKVINNLIVVNEGIKLGEQKVHLLNSKTAFKITAISRDFKYYEEHMKRFLHYVDLEAIQWVNFNKRKITFKTIRKT